MNTLQNNKKQEDLNTNRLMIHLTISFIAALVIIMVSRQLVELYRNSKLYTYLYVIGGISAVLLLASVAYLIVAKMKKVNTSEKILPPVVCILWSAFFLLSMIAVNFYYQYAISACYALLLSFAVIYLIKNVYDKDFYLLSYGLVFSILLFYGLYKVGGDNPFRAFVPLGCILLIALCIFLSVVLWRLKKKDGKLKCCTVFNRSSAYLPSFVFLAMNAIGLVCVLALGASAAYYVMFTMVGFTIVCAVYFTIRLMMKQG